MATPKKISDDDLCPVTNKKHVPNWNSAQITQDGNGTYVDVNCKDCGRSGCVGTAETLLKNISW